MVRPCSKYASNKHTAKLSRGALDRGGEGRFCIFFPTPPSPAPPRRPPPYPYLLGGFSRSASVEAGEESKPSSNFKSANSDLGYCDTLIRLSAMGVAWGACMGGVGACLVGVHGGRGGAWRGVVSGCWPFPWAVSTGGGGILHGVLGGRLGSALKPHYKAAGHQPRARVVLSSPGGRRGSNAAAACLLPVRARGGAVFNARTMIN